MNQLDTNNVCSGKLMVFAYILILSYEPHYCYYVEATPPFSARFCSESIIRSCSSMLPLKKHPRDDAMLRWQVLWVMTGPQI
jgi:hypothetical protein